MNKAERWVEFPDVAERTEGQMTVGYTGLPAGLDPDRLQLNTRVLERGVIGFGGYSALTLAAYEGSEDRYSVGVGADSGGNAYGLGTATVAKAESSRLDPASNRWLNGHDIRNGTLGIQWNINALNGRVKLHEQYDPAVRARQISHEIRGAAIRGIIDHNIKDALADSPLWANALGLLGDSLIFGLISRPALEGNFSAVVSGLAAKAVVMSSSWRAYRVLTNLGTAQFKDIISDYLFWVARPTRAIAGAGVIASSQLVRPTPPKP